MHKALKFFIVRIMNLTETLLPPLQYCRNISWLRLTEGDKHRPNLHSCTFHFHFAVQVGRDHKFVVRNNERNQWHFDQLNKTNDSKADAVNNNSSDASVKKKGFKIVRKISYILQGDVRPS